MAHRHDHDQHELRQRAEERQEDRIGHLRDKLDPETRRLMEELEIHQIELEIQNEELRRAQEELEESRAAYADLYDFAPVGYLTLDEKSRILQANLTAAALLQAERTSLEGSTLLVRVHPEDRNDFFRHLREMAAGEQGGVCELRLKKGNDDYFAAQLESAPAGRTGGQVEIRTSVTDISERRQNEKILRQSEAKYRSLFRIH